MTDQNQPADAAVHNRKSLVDHGNREARTLLVDLIDQVFDALRPDELLEDSTSVENGVLTVGSETYEFDNFERKHLLGFGKGSLAVVEAIRERFDTDFERSLVVEKREQTLSPDWVRVLTAGHPIPSAASEQAGRTVLEFADEVGSDDLVIVAVTGGTSALLAAPPAGVTVEDLATVTDRLLRAGAPIDDLNTVRKHLSRIKGGRFAERLAPATVLGLIVVDEVAGEPWGPTVSDRTTPADARGVLQRYGLWKSVPRSVHDHLNGAAGTTVERGDTPNVLRSAVHNVVLADGTDACEAAARIARERGHEAAILSTSIEGESAEIASALASIAIETAAYSRPFEPPFILVSGGETTVTVPDDAGDGGPNQEFTLACAEQIAGKNIAVAAIGTDGTDGPTDAAGGLVDGTTARRARERGVDLVGSLRDHDSTSALGTLDDVVYTDVGTNLMDLRLFYVGATGSD